MTFYYHYGLLYQVCVPAVTLYCLSDAYPAWCSQRWPLAIEQMFFKPTGDLAREEFQIVIADPLDVLEYWHELLDQFLVVTSTFS